MDQVNAFYGMLVICPTHTCMNTSLTSHESMLMVALVIVSQQGACNACNTCACNTCFKCFILSYWCSTYVTSEDTGPNGVCGISPQAPLLTIAEHKLITLECEECGDAVISLLFGNCHHDCERHSEGLPDHPLVGNTIY